MKPVLYVGHSTATILVLAMLLLGLPMAGAASTPDPLAQPNADASHLWSVQCVDCPKMFTEMTDRSLRLDAAGHPHIAYGRDHLYYAWHDGASWHYEIVDNSAGVGWYAALDLDAASHPHISYYDNLKDDLKYAHWTGSQWLIETVDSEGSVGEHTSIAVDDAGQVYISYHDASDGSVVNEDLNIARWTGSEWIIDTVDSEGAAGWYTSLVLDSAGHPHVSYRGDGQLKLARWTGGEWVVETVAATGGTYASLALDGADRPQISYVSSKELKLARWTGSEWVIETVDSGADRYNYTSLALNADGYPAISYQHLDQRSGQPPDNSLKLARWTGSEWAIETVEGGVYNGYFTALALDAAGQPHISYYDDVPNSLRYAQWTGSDWAIEAVDESEDAGQYASLALDAAGRAAISYLGSTGWNLKVARWLDGDWEIDRLTSQGGLLSTSLALDSDGYPHISHIRLEGTSEKLDYARWTGSDWAVETVDSPVDGPYWSSLAPDSADNPHVGFPTESEYANDLKYARWTGSEWAIERVDSTGWCRFALALDQGDLPSMSYCSTAGAVKLARWTGSEWVTETVDDMIEADGTALALDNAGRPHIAYYASWPYFELKYARWTGSEWAIERLDSSGWCQIALALDQGELPSISYCSNTGALKLAEWTGSEWLIETVPTEGEASSTSLALDAAGKPYVAYYDGATRDLKLAVGEPAQGIRGYFPLILRGAPQVP